ncbi:MAG: tRNA (N(6)-L-threonylcarbamoyladenosine(37)-C(2))-methylthiotransferase [Thermofilaceae archaeon]|nr:tRNA (N(6)-L-threonylcarbamoyladenosine(37)-C(2))-methylthiotransferase [Thermofilaceae archaeon]MDW8004792.1 tRNA (N(6)-L-threonylcarbamoyladenosine(37)-C(2))-methylthiotransferase [Thermofilaceae archaeon]
MQKVYVEHYGCWLNRALTEYIKQIILQHTTLAATLEDADIVVINTCAVRAETERKILARVRQISSRGKRVAVTGCLVNVRPYSILEAAPQASLIDPSSLDDLHRFLKGEDLQLVRTYKLEIHAYKHRGGVRYILPIQVGCLGSCGFCVEPIVRKNLVSLDPYLVVNLVSDAVKKGAKEIFLTGQDVATYGVDKGVKLTDLLKAILTEVDGEYMIRLGMMEPWMVKNITRDLLELMKDKRVYKYLHLPLQSGDDEVLKLMGRKYTSSEYKDLIMFFRTGLKEVSVATDIIVGYPGESWEAFTKSLQIVRELKFDKVHVARYTFRPFTHAYLAGNTVSEPEKKKRSKLLVDASLSVASEVNSKYVGKIIEVLVTEDEKKKGTMIARTNNYKPVIIPALFKPGELIEVKIANSSPLYLVGEPVN